jgi:hypothetical protein
MKLPSKNSTTAIKPHIATFSKNETTIPRNCNKGGAKYLNTIKMIIIKSIYFIIVLEKSDI